MIVNKASVKAAETSFRKIYTDALHGSQAMAMWPRFCQQVSTSAGTVDYSWMAAIPGMRELQGEARKHSLELVNWKVDNAEWENTIAVKEADLERDQLGLYADRFRMQGEVAAQHPDQLLAQLMLDAFSTKDYTGTNFFATGKKHFPSAKATFSNLLTDQLFAASFREARALLKTQKITFPDGSTRQLNLGRKLTLIVSPANESTAREILTAERNAAGATNVDRGTAGLEVWGELGDSPKWFLMDEGFAAKPFVYQVEKAPNVVGVTDPEDSHVVKYHEFLFQAYGRYQVGLFLPQLIVGSTGVDAEE